MEAVDNVMVVTFLYNLLQSLLNSTVTNLDDVRALLEWRRMEFDQHSPTQAHTQANPSLSKYLPPGLTTFLAETLPGTLKTQRQFGFPLQSGLLWGKQLKQHKTK